MSLLSNDFSEDISALSPPIHKVSASAVPLVILGSVSNTAKTKSIQPLSAKEGVVKN